MLQLMVSTVDDLAQLGLILFDIKAFLGNR